jgi:phospholipase C
MFRNASNTAILLFLLALSATGGVLLGLNSCGSDGVSRGMLTKIQHVVVIVQENRSTDNLFQDPVLIGRHADIAQSGLNSKGQVVPLQPDSLVGTYDINHNHPAFKVMYDNGKMDGADLIPLHCPASNPNCGPPNPQFMYVNPAEVQPYFQLAEQYAFADRMFQTNQGPSFPAHQFLISGTSAPSAGSDLLVAENLNDSTATAIAGCIAPPGTYTWLIDPSGSEAQHIYPCFEHPTLTDQLDANNVSWKYYAPSAGSIWTAPDAIQHMCQPQPQNGQLVCTGSTWQKVIIPRTQVLTDIANGQLAAVSWVIPDGRSSDHAILNDGSGPSWVAGVVNAVGNSSYWANTAIVITWDDWGGWYDHVPPNVVNSYEYGFRVPLIVVSPYAKSGYISHVTHDFGSILRLIEEVFNVPGLGYADARADDLTDCFNFNQTPTAFKSIPAAYTAEHFLNDRRPATDPDDD